MLEGNIGSEQDFLDSLVVSSTKTSELLNDSLVSSVVAGENITIDLSDPRNPVVSADTGGAGNTNLSNTPDSTQVIIESDSGSNTTIESATPTIAGVMTSSDKIKLDSIDSYAQVNSVDSVAGKTGDVLLVKSDVGLNNVDNTSDSDKPVSAATQTALDGKVSSVQGGNNVTVDNTDPQNPIISSGGGNTDLSNTASATEVVIESSTGNSTSLVAATVVDAGVMSANDKTKLDSIDNAAEVNNISDIAATDLTDGGDSVLHFHASDRDRGNHTGTQNISTVTNLQSILNAKLDLAGGLMSGGIDMGGKGISNVVTPTLAQDAATKAYVDAIVDAAIRLQSDWDASANTPDITLTTETGFAWRVSVAGTTDVGGITDWGIGDLAVKTDIGWIKISNQDIAAVWGNISGTLSNQVDLQNILNAKFDKTGGNVTGNTTFQNTLTMGSDLDMDGNEIVNLLQSTNASSAATVGQLNEAVTNFVDAQTVRATGNITPTSGTGIEMLYNGTGILASIDRSTNDLKDMLAFSKGFSVTTGATVSTALTALTVDVERNVGIGTSSPAHKLDVSGSVDGERVEISVDNTDQKTIIGSYFEAGVSQYGSIQSTNDAGNLPQTLALNPDGSSVGVGTTTPNAKFEVSAGTIRSSRGNDEQYTEIDNTTSIGGFIRNNSREQNKKALYIDSVHDSGGSSGGFLDIVFRTGAKSSPQEVMRLDENGTVSVDKNFTVDIDTLYVDSVTKRVGINTDAPTTGLTVNGGIDTSSRIRVTGGGTAASPSIQPGFDGDTGMFWAEANTLGFSTAGTERMRIDNEGNVGVGTNNPTTRIHAQSAVSSTIARFNCTTVDAAFVDIQGNASNRVFLGNKFGEFVVQTAGNGFSDKFLIRENGDVVIPSPSGGTDRMHIDSSGNVGIGTNTPNSKLSISGLPIYSDDGTAGSGGLSEGDLYKTTTGELRVKL